MTTPPQQETCEPEAGRHYLNDPNGCVCGHLRLHYGSVDVDRLRALVAQMRMHAPMPSLSIAGVLQDEIWQWAQVIDACLPRQEG